MIKTPMPFQEALEFLVNKEDLPAEWDAATWQEQGSDFVTKAFQSAKVEDARFLDRAHTLLFDYMAKVREEITLPDGTKTTALSVSGRSDFVKLMRDFMIEEGMAKWSDFENVRQTDVTDIRSISRLNLIFDTMVRQSYGFGQWKQGMTPAALYAFPAARLIRDREVAVPRPRHEVNLDEVRLKTDFDWWAHFINHRDIGGFEVPWGPYGFNSGCTQQDVPRSEAIGMGLVPDDGPPRDIRITDTPEIDPKRMNPEIKAKLLEELRKRPRSRDPKEAAREAARKTRVEMLNRGLTDSIQRGDEKKEEKYRKAIEGLGDHST